MHARIRLLASCLIATLLGGCAVGQRLGWTTTRVDATAEVKASCEENTRSLARSPSQDEAMAACMDAKTRQHLRN